MSKKEPKEPEPPPFEDVVAALLKVDPEGITGQSSKDAKARRKATEQEADDS